MQPRFSQKQNAGMTLFEVGVVVAVVMILVVLLIPALSAARRKASTISCVSNLKMIGLAYRVWESDNGNIYPMGISITNGGSMELVTTGNSLATFLVMSNELSTPKVLHCPGDLAHFETSSFVGLTNSNPSYFAAVDVTNDLNPQMILSGDANFEISGVPVKSGLLEIPTNAPIGWTAARHNFAGNYGLTDGSVYQVTTNGLHQALQQTSFATNRLAIP